MKTYNLFRYYKTNKETLGLLLLDELAVYTLEDADRNNQKFVSCIPEGSYLVTKVARSPSGKIRNGFLVEKVPGREGIYIHSGNTALEIEGCILVGLRQGVLNEKLAVLDSVKAMALLNSRLPEKFFLKIKNIYNC